MLSSRSTRLAAILLLVLLFGWTVRGWRKGAVTRGPASPHAVEHTRNAQPDE